MDCRIIVKTYNSQFMDNLSKYYSLYVIVIIAYYVIFTGL